MTINGYTTNLKEHGKPLLSKDEDNISYTEISIRSCVADDSPNPPEGETIINLSVSVSDPHERGKPKFLEHTIDIDYYEAILLRNTLSAVIEYARDYRTLKLYKE